jgi:hypothetical protein
VIRKKTEYTLGNTFDTCSRRRVEGTIHWGEVWFKAYGSVVGRRCLPESLPKPLPSLLDVLKVIALLDAWSFSQLGPVTTARFNRRRA